MQILAKGDIIGDPAKTPGLREAPCWIARLSNRRTVIGAPTWFSSGQVALPNEGAFISADLLRLLNTVASDWQRLMLLCADEHLRVEELSLYVPRAGLVEAPPRRAAYGYAEMTETSTSTGITRRELKLFWTDRLKSGRHVIRQVGVSPNGVRRNLLPRPYWLNCMIGERVF